LDYIFLLKLKILTALKLIKVNMKWLLLCFLKKLF